MKSYHVGVSAEAFVAAIFARAGFHVSVQYGANQPGYDLIVEKEKKSYLISVKGSQDGGWGLTQTHLKNADYHAAIDSWHSKHTDRIIFCFVQFKGKDLHEMPDFYLARTSEVADHLRASGLGLGDTILHVEKTWKSGRKGGHTDRIPESWRCTPDRIDQICNPNAEQGESGQLRSLRSLRGTF
jgi:hypothetical protein